jgi:hypothetical protein
MTKEAHREFVSVESMIPKLLREKTFLFPYPEASSDLSWKEATNNDMKNAGGRERCVDAQTREWHFYDISSFI